MRTIDLNCDVGEWGGAPAPGISAPGMDAAHAATARETDAALLRFVSSANIACAGHAGDDASMRATIALAKSLGVAVGAHPSYPDRAGFGRVSMKLAPSQIEAEVATQVGALAAIARELGATLRHVKPHGALYHDGMTNPEIARAVALGARSAAGPLLLVGLAGAPALDVWRSMGFTAAAEAFADRRYERDGSLRPRTRPGALLSGPKQAGEQTLRIARDGCALTEDGAQVNVRADTICIHSDTPGAPEIARAVAEALGREGVRVGAGR